MAQGLEKIPLRIPAQWDASWFERFIREVLAKADIRNSIEGPGIQIVGQSDEPATVSSSEDLMQLLEQSFILALPSSFLANERILQGEANVIEITDDGPGGDITIRIKLGGVQLQKIAPIAGLTLIGNIVDETAPPAQITGTAEGQVPRIAMDGSDLVLEFGQVATLGIEDEAVTLAKHELADTDGKLLIRRSGAMAYDTLDDGDIPAGIARDSEVAAAITAHEGASDPHPVYTTAAELSSALSALDLASGVYTPTLTNVANLDASTAYQCQYMRVGSVVTVSGKIDIDPTLAATSTQLGISLPIASNLGAAEDCAGTAFASGIAGQGAAILGDATNNRAQLQYISGDITNQPLYFQFTYRII